MLLASSSRFESRASSATWYLPEVPRKANRTRKRKENEKEVRVNFLEKLVEHVPVRNR